MRGHAQTEETKKKISEALKKGGSKAAPANQSSRFEKQYNDSQSKIDSIKSQMDSLKGKKDKKSKDKLKELKKQAKLEKGAQSGVMAVAMRAKAVAHAKATIAKQQSNLKKADMLEAKAKALMAQSTQRIAEKAKKSKGKTSTTVGQSPADRLASALEKINAARARAKESIASAEAIIKSGGAQKKKSVFDFSEHFCLSEQQFRIWRELSIQEQKIDWYSLNQAYDNQQQELKNALIAVIGIMIARGLLNIKNRLKAGDIAGIGAISIVSQNQVNGVVNEHIKKAYELGKTNAAKEIGVAKPVTPTIKTQLMNLDSSMIAEQIATNIDLAAKQKARDGFAKGVVAVAVVAAAAQAARQVAAKMITQTTGNIIGENINKGRQLIFQQNIENIQGFQRSEILDNRTCALCEELDEQIVSAHDPMAQLDQVHTNCRGIWIPILANEEFNPNEAGLSSEAQDAFDTMGGVPTINSFEQLKKPLDAAGKKSSDSIINDLRKDEE